MTEYSILVKMWQQWVRHEMTMQPAGRFLVTYSWRVVTIRSDKIFFLLTWRSLFYPKRKASFVPFWPYLLVSCVFGAPSLSQSLVYQTPNPPYCASRGICKRVYVSWAARGDGNQRKHWNSRRIANFCDLRKKVMSSLDEKATYKEI